MNKNLFGKNLIRNFSLLAAACVALTSCHAINDDHGPCPEEPVMELRFLYDYNLLYANAFYSQVHCLGVYIFDEAGVLVKERHEADDTNLSDELWRLKIEDLKPGNYQILAYGGMECEKKSFSHRNQFQIGSSRIEDVEVELNAECFGQDSEIADRDLHENFYGMSFFTMPKEGRHSEDVPMMRNTNTLHVTLQHVDGSELDVNDFHFTITDDNNNFNHTNDLLETGEIVYRPFEKTTTSTGTKADGDEDLFYAATANFKTSRFVADKSTVTTLSVKSNQDDHEVLRLPLLNYLCMTNNYPMSDQEYLDRKFDYNLVVFLRDDNSTWVQVQIVVEDWSVRVDNIEAE